jgi:hypothetical protein
MAAVLRLSAALALALALAACQQPASNGATTPAPVETNTAAMAPAAPAAAPSSGDAADAKAFLDGLYAHYKTSKDNTFAPFDTKAGVLDGDTIALMKADEKALKGDVGDIDGDWLCDCQDFESITATVTVQSATPTSAKATALFHDTIDTGAPKRDTFDLVKTPAGWRIHDMGTPDQPSLRKVLEDEIARLKVGGKPTGGSD